MRALATHGFTKKFVFFISFIHLICHKKDLARAHARLICENRKKPTEKDDRFSRTNVKSGNMNYFMLYTFVDYISRESHQLFFACL